MITRNEWILLGKLGFIIFGVMLLIAMHNSMTLPAGQFIYGRF